MQVSCGERSERQQAARTRLTARSTQIFVTSCANLTSNLKSSLDKAFLRRSRFIVQFAFPDAALRAHEGMWRATEAGIAAARPGATTDDVHRVMAAIIDAAGSLGNNVGRLGHGLGMQLTEPPSHMPGDGTVLTEGMVLTIEPGIEYAPGRMIVHEENLVVRAGPPDLLTRRAPREMPRIG